MFSGGRVTPTPTEQAQLPSEPASPRTAAPRLSPEVGKLPYSSREPEMAPPESVSALPITFPPTSSVKSPLERESHSKAATEVGFPSVTFISSGGPPAS